MRFPRSSGVLLHPTSLPGRFGIGDLGAAAFRFLDDLAAAGQLWWQILPFGPTGAGNSPYQSHSSFAGNPLLICPDSLVADGLLGAADLPGDPGLPADEVDFLRVGELKEGLLRRAFASFSADDEGFRGFLKRSEGWLDDYALYMALKRVHGGLSWVDWEPELARREPGAIDRSRRELEGEVRYHQFVQYVFDRQWGALREACRERGIRLIGDIPIFVSHDSADVWSRPDLFFLEPDGRPTFVAGVPPDYFSETGQLWGNPLYRWDRHAEEGYAWWISRLGALLERVDLVRIDHFRGFEAYWEVPGGAETAIHGRWAPGPGGDFFRAVQARFVSLPLIAEDLGVITPAVAALRDEFDLPGMRILQFGFGSDPEEEKHLPHRFDRHCLVYTGTHDNDTSLGWLAADPTSTTLSAEEMKAERDLALRYVGGLERDFAWDMIRTALGSTADIAIVPLQDVLSLDSSGRMNVPGKAEGNWGWRFREEALTPDRVGRLAELTSIFGRWNGVPPPRYDYRHRARPAAEPAGSGAGLAAATSPAGDAA